MLPNRKSVFIKTWLWSLIGGGALAALFWFFTDIVHIFQNLNSLSAFTNIVLAVSIVGNILGAGLVTWRIADKHYHARATEAMKRYWLLSLLSLVVAAVIIFILTPITPIIALWNLVAPLCSIKAIEPAQ